MCVDSQMSLQISTMTECFITHITWIRAFPCMTSQMDRQMLFPLERFPTSWAGIRCLIWMSFCVVVKITAMTEMFVTNRAHIKSSTGIESFMNTQMTFMLESFPRSCANMVALLWMTFHNWHRWSFFTVLCMSASEDWRLSTRITSPVKSRLDVNWIEEGY